METAGGKAGKAGPDKARVRSIAKTQSKRDVGGKMGKKPDGEEKLRKSPIDTSMFKDIKNKERRQEAVGKAYYERKRERTKVRRAKQEAEKRGETVERGVTNTIESMREEDETLLPPDDEEVQGEDNMDEFESYFDDSRTPKIMITTKVSPSAKVFDFLKEWTVVVPNVFITRARRIH